jgi:hypothetical protein
LLQKEEPDGVTIVTHFTYLPLIFAHGAQGSPDIVRVRLLELRIVEGRSITCEVLNAPS